MHRAQARVVLSFFLCAALAQAGQAQVPGKVAHHPGVVVEELVKDSPPERAGVRKGDILLRWTRAATPPANLSARSGEFRTPIDVEEVAVDEAERGRLTLLVDRKGKELSLVIPPGSWSVFDGIMVGRQTDWPLRPRLAGDELARYRHGLQLVEGGATEKGAAVWKSLATDWTRMGAQRAAVWLFMRAGMVLGQAKKFADAQEALDLALATASKSGPTTPTRQIWMLKAILFRRDREPDRAVAAAQQIVRIGAGEPRPSLWTATAFSFLCTLAYRAGKPIESASFARQAVEAAERAAPANLSAATALGQLGSVAMFLDDLQAAEQHLRAALVINERLLPRTECFPELLNLGSVLMERGNLAGAEALFRETLMIARRLSPGETDEAYCLGNMGVLEFRRGDFTAAEQYMRGDLVIEESVAPRGPAHAEALSNLADTVAAKGDLGAAEDLYGRALEIRQELSPDSFDVAICLNGLGRLAIRRNDPASARRHFERAVGIHRKLAPDGLGEAESQNGLGDAALALGDLHAAQVSFEVALKVRERLAPGTSFSAETRHNLGLVARRTGNLSKAVEHFRAAIDAVESQTRNLGGTEETKSGFGAAYKEYYRDYIDALIELNGREDAFNTLERSRARSLLSMLSERDLVLAVDIPSNLERERKLTNGEYDRTQGELRELNPTENAAEIDAALGRLKDLRQKQAEIADRIKNASPRYAALQYPQSLVLAGVQSALDSGTLLLSYAVGKERSYLFVVSPDPKRGPPVSVFTLPIGEPALRESVQAFRKLIEWNKAPADLISRSQSLYKMLLEPAEALIGKADRLLILPDGPLHTLPWAALVRDVKAGKPQYAVEWKPIHTAVSATVYAELKRPRKQQVGASAVEMAAFGDPRYPTLPEKRASVRRGDSDEPSTEGLEGEDAIADPQLRSVARGGFRFEPLPASRQEVEQIASLYAPKAATYLGPDATEEKAKAIGKDVPLIHYACHAVVNERFPLDSALVFTIPDKPNEGQDNGLLQAWEIFEKVRIDADLVTLSACESGLGKEMGGEGLIGLTRAFQYAGARSILASLWKVEDQSTGELMKRFYRYLKSGTAKDEALRLAQIDLIHSPNFSQPKDWAAFELIGDWK